MRSKNRSRESSYEAAVMRDVRIAQIRSSGADETWILELFFFFFSLDVGCERKKRKE